MELLDKIYNSQDVKELEQSDLPRLCSEIREFLINNVSRTGGHLASNLGIVELTVAIHRIFDLSNDRAVFDVGHQSYVHKILSGRKDRFSTLRQLGGLSGFPKPNESDQDAFIAGHASNSVSVALGMARGRTILNDNYNVLSVIGDGALTGGLAYEALNDAGQSGEPLVVILNDNGMAITGNVGGMAQHLAKQRTKPGYYKMKRGYRKFVSRMPGGKMLYRLSHKFKTTIKNAIFHCSMFEEMGFHYLGPVDGHDMEQLINVLSWAKRLREPVLVHVSTQKGKGYRFSELDPDEYHGVSKFDAEKGVEVKESKSFSSAFGDTMIELAEKHSNLCAISAAMVSGTGLKGFAKMYPDRFFDVGIAEGHAAAMTGGMAKQGLVPVFAVYSTFLQRSFDMLIHDIALQNLHVVLAVDRAGLVGADGETHQGAFDAAFLSEIPGMTILCPASFSELAEMLKYAVSEVQGPVAVRYPRGGEGLYKACAPIGEKTSVVRKADDVTLISYGTMINNTLQAAVELMDKDIKAEIVKLNSIKPIDYDTIEQSVIKTGRVFIVEDCVAEGCVGQRILAEMSRRGVNIDTCGLINLGDNFIPHGEVSQLHEMCNIDGSSIAQQIVRHMVSGRE